MSEQGKRTEAPAAPVQPSPPIKMSGSSLRLLTAMVSRLRYGSLRLRLPDGQSQIFKGMEAGPEAEVLIRDPRMVTMILRGGSAGMGEAYMRGWFDTPDLAALIELGARNREAVERLIVGNPVFKSLRWVWNRLHRDNTRRGSRRNIAHHYDLGNEFYRTWLDPSMTYSSALYDDIHGEETGMVPTDNQDEGTLAQAQANKYRHIALAAGITPNASVLEIGCGWGGFACYAGREIGCHVTAITVSREQHDYAAARVQSEGLGERVAIRLQDYRDIEPGRFDAIASIEMFEAVGERHWPVFFSKLAETLRPGGRAALQVITIADHLFETYRRKVDFIQKYIFPGGMLPCPSVLSQHIGKAGMTLEQDRRFGLSYAHTLATWQQRFQAAWPDIAQQGFDLRFKRMWEFYLAYCEAGFRANTIDVHQLALSR